MKKYSAVINRRDGDFFVNVELLETKEVGIFKKRKKYLVAYKDVTHFPDRPDLVNDKVVWVGNIYENKPDNQK